MKKNRLFWIAFLTIAMIVSSLPLNVNADEGGADVTVTNASGTTTRVTVSGESDTALAVAIQLRDSTGAIRAMKTAGVVNGTFSAVFTFSGSGVLSAGDYTAYAANYEGGAWATKEFTISAPSYSYDDWDDTPSVPVEDPNTKVEKNADGTSTKTVEETKTSADGKEMKVTTTTSLDANGQVTGSVEKTEVAEVAKDTKVTVEVSKDADGEVTGATADVEVKPTDSGKTVLSGDVIDQIKDIGGSCEIKVTARDNEGNALGTLSVDTEDIKPGKKLYMYGIDKNGNIFILDDSKVKVKKSGTVKVEIPAKGDYELLSKSDSKAAKKQILDSCELKKDKISVDVNDTAKIKLSSDFSKKNVEQITYKVNGSKNVTIDKNGKITAKSAGKVKVDVEIILKGGMKKTLTVEITIS